ncbi:hypothetical protein [Paenibacillus riograndensis]|uniref:Uncharacterized protein n=1 Tax=Paenibacillus riograndensis SBR5 TaxID=1073571 RepID=A0A0E4CVW0_9BACL|nr:hypothetical protein [Paenibacillus riograndensis]CQR54607.1 hypothetical protein PRIO_2198 [Paenibacillus riograndensis SBR5]
MQFITPVLMQQSGEITVFTGIPDKSRLLPQEKDGFSFKCFHFLLNTIGLRLSKIQSFFAPPTASLFLYILHSYPFSNSVKQQKAAPPTDDSVKEQLLWTFYSL